MELLLPRTNDFSYASISVAFKGSNRRVVYLYAVLVLVVLHPKYVVLHPYLGLPRSEAMSSAIRSLPFCLIVLEIERNRGKWEYFDILLSWICAMGI